MKQPGRPSSDWIVSVQLPWPAKELSPNRRQHWAKKATAVDLYRAGCRHVAGKLQLPTGADQQPLHLFLDFFPPDRRRYDIDNLIARMKSGIDGFFSGLGIDDVQIRAVYARIDAPVEDGAVHFRISPWTPNA